jgi:hypothetical protein
MFTRVGASSTASARVNPSIAAQMLAPSDQREPPGRIWPLPYLAAIKAPLGELEPSALVARRLLETRVLTCAAPSYLAKHGRPAHPRDLGAGSHECTCHRPAISLEISPRPAETSGRGFRPPDGEQRRHDVGCLRRRSWSGATSRARDRRSPRSRETHRAVPRFVGRAVSALRNPSFTTRAARKGARIPGFRSRLGSLTARFTRTKPGPCPLGA